MVSHMQSALDYHEDFQRAHLKLESLLSESARSAVARKSAKDLCWTGSAFALASACLGD